MAKYKWYFIILIPLICLGFFYKQSLKKSLRGNFERHFNNYSFDIIDSLQLGPSIFGMILSQEKIYTNDGTNIKVLDFSNHSSKTVISKNITKEPIMSFGVDSLSIFYRISNDEKIFFKSLKTNSINTYVFPIFAGDMVKINNKFLMQELIPKTGAITLKVFNPSDKTLSKMDDILPNMEGSFMLTSGKWISNYNSKNIFLMCYYLDEIYMFSNDGIFVKKIKPIDCSSEKAEVTFSGERYAFKGGTRMHRYTSSANNKYLYVASSVRGDNEDSEKWKDNSVIDVYDIESSGNYSHSFYVPKYKKKRFTDIVVSNHNDLYVLYKDEVVHYKINNIR